MKKVMTRVTHWVEVFKRKNDFSRLDGIDMENIDGDKLRFFELRKALLLLPDSILERLRARKVRIVYCKDSVPVSNGKYAGYFRRDSQFIYVWDSGANSLEWQKITILHEVGHFLDHDLTPKVFRPKGYQSYSELNLGFKEAAQEEQCYYNRQYNQKLGDYYKDRPTELFAQGFAEYFSRKSFKDECPLTTDMIRSMLETL